MGSYLKTFKQKNDAIIMIHALMIPKELMFKINATNVLINNKCESCNVSCTFTHFSSVLNFVMYDTSKFKGSHKFLQFCDAKSHQKAKFEVT